MPTTTGILLDKPAVIKFTQDQLAQLERLFSKHPRIRRFEQSARACPELATVPGIGFAVWWRARTSQKEDSERPPSKHSILPTPESRPRSQLTLNSTMLPRPTPIRNFSPCATARLSTLVLKPKKSVVELLELAAVQVEEEELRKANLEKHEAERKANEGSVAFSSLSLTIGSWTRRNTSDEPLSTVFSRERASFEWCTCFNSTLYRILIPLSHLSSLTFSPTSLTLNLHRPPHFRTKPQDNSTDWLPSSKDFTAGLHASSESQQHVLLLSSPTSLHSTLLSLIPALPLLGPLLAPPLLPPWIPPLQFLYEEYSNPSSPDPPPAFLLPPFSPRLSPPNPTPSFPPYALAPAQLFQYPLSPHEAYPSPRLQPLPYLLHPFDYLVPSSSGLGLEFGKEKGVGMYAVARGMY